MKKYLAVFKISFQQEFAYKLSFIMWRFRNVLQVFIVFSFWSSLFSSGDIIFGYDKSRILTYTICILFMKAIVMSARAVDISGQIQSGDLSNLLLKPIGFIKYWFTRDLASKSLNILFVIFEISILYFILRPPLFIPNDIFSIAVFCLLVVVAIFLFYLLLFCTNMITFWMPENGWASQFLIIVILTDFLSGAIFPLDIFPQNLQRVFSFLPFQYLVYFPIQVYLGKVEMLNAVSGLAIGIFWICALYFIMISLWRKGLKVYASEGR